MQLAPLHRGAFGDSESSLIQHVTDDQDMLQDVLDSASASGFSEGRVYRGLRMKLEEQQGNQSGADKIAHDSMETRAVVNTADQKDIPDFSKTAGKEFGCYLERENVEQQMQWVELRDGNHQVEKLLAAPSWLIQGPGGDQICFTNEELATSAIRHCVGKDPKCLYPKRWRPGAVPEGWCG